MEDTNGAVRYYGYNIHGDAVELYDSTGRTVYDYRYDAFGNQRTANAGDTNPFRYCGEYYDSETGLIYLRNRYYNTNTGRFITEDPIRDGLNWYVYCGNNPVCFVDPLGLAWNWLENAIENIENATDIFKSGMEEIIDEVAYYADKGQKQIQREVWKFGAQHLLREKWGYLTSAWMLEHSLQDKPSDIRRGNDSRIAYLINNDSTYLNELDKAIDNSDGKTIDALLENVQFNNGDLYYSIHRSSICVQGYKQTNGKWIIHATLTDTYDFTEIQSFMDDGGGWSDQATKGTLANDIAVISQKMGAINPYKVTVDFYTTR